MKVLKFLFELIREFVLISLVIVYVTLPTIVAMVAKDNRYLLFHIVTLGTISLIFTNALKQSKKESS